MWHKFQRKYGHHWKSDFFKNMRTLMAGTVFGQLIVLAFTPILSRIYTPEDFTTLEQFIMILNIAVVVITGKYEFAIMHPKKNEDARHIVVLSALLALFGSLLFVIFGLLFSESIAIYYNNPDMGQYFWLLGPSLFGFALFNITNYWFSRQKKYQYAATSKILNASAGEPIKYTIGIVQPSASGLLWGTTLGFCIGGLYSAWRYLKTEAKGFSEWTKAELFNQAKTYKDYPCYSIWGSILNRLAQWAHVGIFTHFYGLIAIGWMALSRRVVQAPLNVISGSYSQVFFQRISEIEDPKELSKVYYKALWQFVLIAIFIVFIVFALPESTMGFVFGENWLPAISYLRILTLWYALNFITSSLSFVALRIQMQRVALVLDIMHFIFVYGAVIGAYYMNCNEYQATLVLVLSKVVYFIINLTVLSWRLNQYVHQNAK
jgi:O-antigen/teichoic acid export membrane protein